MRPAASFGAAAAVIAALAAANLWMAANPVDVSPIASTRRPHGSRSSSAPLSSRRSVPSCA